MENAVHTNLGCGSVLKSAHSAVEKRLASRSENCDSVLATAYIPETTQSSDDEDDADPTYNPPEGSGAIDPLTDQLINHFFTEINSPNGGKRDVESAKKECLEIRRIYAAISAKSISEFLNAEKINKLYLSGICKERNYKADTVRKYIGSLKDFCRFIVAEEKTTLEITTNKLVALIHKLEQWSKSYKKDAKERFWERAEEDFEMLVTPDQLATYEQSDHARSAVKLFGQFSSPYFQHQITMKEYCTMRDYLLTKIHFGTGCDLYHQGKAPQNLQLPWLCAYSFRRPHIWLVADIREQREKSVRL